MNPNSLSFDEFAEKLKKRSNSELVKLSKGYGIELPTGLSEKAIILRAMYDALQGSDPTAAVESSAPSSPPPAAVGPQISVLSTTGHKSYWRCGHKFTPEWQMVPVSKFTADEILQLKRDPHLKVRDVGQA